MQSTAAMLMSELRLTSFAANKVLAARDVFDREAVFIERHLEPLIKRFPDEIFVPIDVSQQSMNKTFNSILTKLSKKVKQKIM